MPVLLYVGIFVSQISEKFPKISLSLNKRELVGRKDDSGMLSIAKYLANFSEIIIYT